MDRYRFFVRDNKIVTTGINWGYGNHDLGIVHKTEHFMLWRKPPTQDWQGVGLGPGYFPVIYILVRVEEDEVNYANAKQVGVVIEECEPGRKWKSERQRLIDKANELEANFGRDREG